MLEKRRNCFRHFGQDECYRIAEHIWLELTENSIVGSIIITQK